MPPKPEPQALNPEQKTYVRNAILRALYDAKTAVSKGVLLSVVKAAGFPPERFTYDLETELEFMSLGSLIEFVTNPLNRTHEQVKLSETGKAYVEDYNL